MRILFAVHTYEPEANGVQMVTKYLAEGLAKKYEVFCLTDQKNDVNGNLLPEAELINNVQVYRRKMTDEESSEDEHRNRYMAIIRDVNPDVLIAVCTQIWTFDLIKNHLDLITCKKILYTHGFSHLNWTVRKVLKKNISKGTLRAIPTELKYVKRGFDYYKNLAPILAKFDAVTYLSDTDDSYKWAQEHGLNNSVVITNACDDWFFDNAKKSYEFDDVEEGHELTFIYVANYERRKNQKLLVEAFCKANIDNSRLVMVGRGDKEYYSQVQQLIAEKLQGESNRILAEYNVPREKVLEYYLQADVAVTTSHWEAFSITLCEAAALGMPIISTDVGNASYFSGILLANSIDEIASEMMKMSDVSAREEHGRKLYNYAVSNCKVESRVELLEELL